MITTKINVNNVIKNELSIDPKSKENDNSESTSNCESSTDDTISENNKTSQLDDDKLDSYLISWNNIFYEVDNHNFKKTNLISKLFKKNKFKDDKIDYQSKSNNIHIIERHNQRIEIINNQKTLHINQQIKNETIKQINDQPNKRIILNNISGSLASGKLLALIGPSGVGKSTLLQILSGRRKYNVKGNVYLHSTKESNLKNCKLNKLSFIPQNDTHIENLTVKETLLYASKLKNNEKAKEIIKLNNQDNNSNTTISLQNTSPTNSSIDTIYSGSNLSSTSSSSSSSNNNNSFNIQCNNVDNNNLSNNHLEDNLEVNINDKQQAPSIILNFTNVDQYHEYLVNEIISELMLDNCSDTFVYKCSGGQLKRLSIAMELLSQPKVIIMDEPTTGLDFSSALNCIQILKNLTLNTLDPPAIIVSIHQPSSSVVKLFDKLYVLGKGGSCLYNGTTSNLVNYLNRFNFNCPKYFNPTDLLIQISSLDYGERRFKEMINYQSIITKQELNKEINSLKYKFDLSKLIDNIDVKKPNISNQIKLLIERDIKNSSRRPLLNILRFCYFSFFAFFIYFTYNYDIGTFNGCYTELINMSNNLNKMNYAQKLAQLSDNSSILFFITMFLVISSIMPASLTFGNEINIFIKERSNCWYSTFCYYSAKFLADLPSYVIFPMLFTCLFYPLTSQIEDTIRFLWFNLIVILNSLITRSIGMIIGSIFLNDTLSAVFVSTCAIFPFMLSAGFLIRASVTTWVLKPFWYLSFIRYTFACLLIIIYGWGRCLIPTSSSLNHEPLNIFTDNETLSNQNSQLIDNLALSGLKSLISNYLKPNEMKCLINDQNGNFSLFTDLINECDVNVGQIKNSMISNLTLTNLERYDHSFILNYFELTNQDFPIYVLNLVVIFISLTIINYWILLYRIKKVSSL